MLSAQSVCSACILPISPPKSLAYCVEGAYGDNKFSSEDIAPIHELKAGEEILELWRGPTCAFKDMALQMGSPRLMTVSVKKAVGTRETRYSCRHIG